MKKITRRFLLLASAVFALSLLVSCEDEKTPEAGQEPSPETVSAVTFKPKVSRVVKGSKVSLTSSGADIYYEIVKGNAESTLTEKNYASFNKYKKTIEAPEGKIYAIAVKNGKTSEIKSMAYTLLSGQSAIPTDELKVEVEDTTYNWADWNQEDEIPYEEPVSGITRPNLELITVGPGADCSKEMTICWHSPVPVNYVEYAMADDTAFANSRKIWIKAELTQADKFEGKPGNDGKSTYGWIGSDSHSLDNTKFYVCKATLTKLKPDTAFIYRVGTNEPTPKVSGTYKFKTAGNCGGQFTFFWSSDLHTPKGSSSYYNRVSELIDFSNANLAKKSLPEIGYVLFTGDLVNQGGRYSNWLNWDKIPELKEFMWASCVGNHDYYFWNGHETQSGDKSRVSGRWQFECTAFPDTNKYTKDGVVVELPPSHYWYLYNRVLFIGIDSMYEEALDPYCNTTLAKQIAWFEAAVKENEGKYDYIVAFQHYAYIVNNEIMYGNYNDWKSVYDAAGVDFALSSDSHEYDRTYELYKGSAIADDGHGTVYVTSPMTEGSEVTSIDNNANISYNSKSEFYGGWCVGASYFVVNSNSITLNTIGRDGKIYDTKSVGRKKRAWN
ncbi:MAG: metallophosphoesterase family protein [Treponema sp.]|nr:metallophosphoesterase family protein [Treponema sp.]